MISVLTSLASHICGLLLGLIFITHALGPAAPPEGILASLLELRIYLDAQALPYAISADQFLQAVPFYPTIREWFMDPGLATLNKYPAAYLAVLSMVTLTVLDSLTGSIRISAKVDPRINNADAKASAVAQDSSRDTSSIAATPSLQKPARRHTGIERINPWRK